MGNSTKVVAGRILISLAERLSPQWHDFILTEAGGNWKRSNNGILKIRATIPGCISGNYCGCSWWVNQLWKTLSICWSLECLHIPLIFSFRRRWQPWKARLGWPSKWPRNFPQFLIMKKYCKLDVVAHIFRDLVASSKGYKAELTQILTKPWMIQIARKPSFPSLLFQLGTELRRPVFRHQTKLQRLDDNRKDSNEVSKCNSKIMDSFN